MLTLSYGFKKPEDDDTADLWWPAMAANMQLLNDHTHDGTDSASLVVTTQSISSGSWGSDLGGSTYKQTVTLPGTLQFDDISIEIRLASTNEVIYPAIIKASANTYDIYVSDNSLNLTAVYST